ncbi:MAG: hypothetical protein PHV95_03915 [Eubacteriales bacterium]|nr:hypothetical protein [Eubacteriales bacterium]
MKKLLKNKLFISCASAFLVVILVITAIILIPDKSKIPTTDDTSGSSDVSISSPDINVNAPTASDQTTTSTDDPENKDNSDLTVNVGGGNSNNSNNSKTPAKDSDKPVSTQEPTQSDGIVIGGDTNSETKYDCKTPNHHCQNAENHAYITNLELQGCPICGSHSCPSFYAVNEWGYTRYDMSKCPKYDIKKDPLYYCQDCGRKVGNGDNNTCQQFVVDTVCPICGKLVKANTCHTH